MSHSNVVTSSPFSRCVLPSGLLTLLLFTGVLLAPTTQFAAEPLSLPPQVAGINTVEADAADTSANVSVDATQPNEQTIANSEQGIYRQLVLLDGVALTELFKSENESIEDDSSRLSQTLSAFQSGFSIECSARFDSECKLFPIAQD